MRPDDNRGRRPGLSYVLPLRRWEDEPLGDLVEYLESLAEEPGVEVLVVDGSPEALFARHRAAWGAFVTHMPVRRDSAGGYDKVNGVLTGIRAARSEHVVIADDDVRYSGTALREMARRLEHADLVRPQNYFDPLPWHARWDTARTLINRSVAYDFPGTLGVRRSTLLGAGGYDANVLFENLELIRTVEVAGGVVCNSRDLYVRRLPPSAAHFWSQRIRQAYDSFAQPARLAIELSLLPWATRAVVRRRFASLAVGAAAAVGMAEAGRRRAGGTTVFPASCSLFAPAWTTERAVCIWLAVWSRLRHGGMPYAGTTLVKAANSPRTLRRRLGAGVPRGPRPARAARGSPARLHGR